VTVLGLGEPAEGGFPSRSEAAIVTARSSHRICLHVPVDPEPVGPAWSVLEAMASGRPVVALGETCEPVVDGISGYVGADPAVQRLRAVALLEDPSLAECLGAAGRRTVAETHGIGPFLAAWAAVIADLTRR